MTTEFLVAVLQTVIALTILNVWLARFGRESPYRGGGAATMREEFAVYGLPNWSVLAVGGAKVALALFLLAGLWIDSLTRPAAIGLAVFMLGAVWMHVRVGDPPTRSVPAASLLGMAIVTFLLA
jgi:uncharacterized membrane protein YphA (DoxX/SURF4 family)